MNKFMKQLKKRMNERVKTAVECLQDARNAAKCADYSTSAMILEIARLSGLDIKDSYIAAHNDCTTLSFTVNCSNGLKTKGITAMIAYLSEYAGEANCSDHASDWCASRSFDFGTWEDTFRVHMHCDIPTNAKGCRKVAVGETVKTVMQYRIECDDDNKI